MQWGKSKQNNPRATKHNNIYKNSNRGNPHINNLLLWQKLGNKSQGKYDFICDDFYKFKFPEGGYDLVYDYT